MIEGEECQEIKGEAGLCHVYVITQNTSFHDWDITAAFEGAATGHHFDVGLSYNAIFIFLPVTVIKNHPCLG